MKLRSAEYSSFLSGPVSFFASKCASSCEALDFSRVLHVVLEQKQCGINEIPSHCALFLLILSIAVLCKGLTWYLFELLYNILSKVMASHSVAQIIQCFHEYQLNSNDWIASFSKVSLVLPSESLSTAMSRLLCGNGAVELLQNEGVELRFSGKKREIRLSAQFDHKNQHMIARWVKKLSKVNAVSTHVGGMFHFQNVRKSVLEESKAYQPANIATGDDNTAHTRPVRSLGGRLAYSLGLLTLGKEMTNTVPDSQIPTRSQLRGDGKRKNGMRDKHNDVLAEMQRNRKKRKLVKGSKIKALVESVDSAKVNGLSMLPPIALSLEEQAYKKTIKEIRPLLAGTHSETAINKMNKDTLAMHLVALWKSSDDEASD